MRPGGPGRDAAPGHGVSKPKRFRLQAKFKVQDVRAQVQGGPRKISPPLFFPVNL